MMRQSFLLLFFVFTVAMLNARTVNGVVVSSADSAAIGGASCRLLSQGEVIGKSVSDDKGAFTMVADSKTALNLEVSHSGYSSTVILIEPDSKNLDLGTIYLDKNLQLGEVTVEAGGVFQKKGRMIYLPLASDVRASSTTLSLLQKLPFDGLDANPINRSLTVDGAAPVILIDGVPSTLEDVHSLQPKNIARIEYSRFTPARYADSGKSGLISITLKKRTDGGQTYLWGRTAVTTAFVDANLNASYHQGPSQLSLSYIPSWRNYQKVYDFTTESYIGDGFRVDLREEDRNPFNYHIHQMRMRYNYSPSARTLFSATFNAQPFFNSRRSIAHTSDSQLGEYDNRNRSHSKDFAPSLDLFLRHDFNDRNSLEAEVVGTLSSSDYRRDNNYFFADGTEESYLMNVDSRRRSLISEVSYIHKFSDLTELSAGYQNTLSHSRNKYLTSDYRPVLTENNNYAYVRLGQSVGNVYFTVSTGAKMFWIHNDLNRRHFIRNLTSARVSWKIDSRWSLWGNFRYSPVIPSLSSLTDYPQQTTPYLVSNGNPGLKVAENFSYGLGVSFRHRKFQAAFSSAYVDARKAAVSDVTYVGDGLFLSQTVNSRYSRVVQNDLTLRLSDIHGFGARLYLCLTHYRTAGESWSHSLTSFDASLSVWWNKGPYTVSYWRKLPGKYLSGHRVGKDENGDMLQFEYKPDKHWTLGLGWMYMFDRKGTRYPAWNYSAVNPSTLNRYIKNNSNMVVVSATYSADFGSIFRSARRNLNNTDSGSSLLKL